MSEREVSIPLSLAEELAAHMERLVRDHNGSQRSNIAISYDAAARDLRRRIFRATVGSRERSEPSSDSK